MPKNKWVTGVELYPSSNNHGKMGPPNSSSLLNTAIFHFHDCGRKSISLLIPGLWVHLVWNRGIFFKIHCGESIDGANKPLPSSVAFFVFGPIYKPKRGAMASDRHRSFPGGWKSKNREGYPKMDGENNRKNPINPWMIFWGKTPLFFRNILVFFPWMDLFCHPTQPSRNPRWRVLRREGWCVFSGFHAGGRVKHHLLLSTMKP